MFHPGKSQHGDINHIASKELSQDLSLGHTVPEFVHLMMMVCVVEKGKGCCKRIKWKKYGFKLTCREVGGGFRMGNTCIFMADSCQCMAKTTTIL